MLVVGLAALVVRLAYLLATGTLAAPPPEYNEQVRMARYLCHGRGFVCPVGPERDDPSSWYSPGFITLVALIFRACGEATPLSWAAIRLMNLGFQAAALGIWFAIARRLLGRRAAAATALLLIFSPPLVYESRGIWDTHLLLLAGAAGTAFFTFVPVRRHVAAAASGVLCGLIAYVNPCLTLCYPVWWFWNRGLHRGKPVIARNGLGLAAAAVLAFLATIAPWTLRNRAVFGDWFYMRGNLGMELWVGAAPWSEGSIISVDNERVHPVFDDVEARRMVEMGEYAYFQACKSEALGWWKNEPRRMAGLTLNRIKWFWFGRYPAVQSLHAKTVKLFGVTLIGAGGIVGGLVLLWRRRRVWVIPAMVLVFPIPYYLTITAVRYRAPIEPVLILALAWLAAQIPRRGAALAETIRAPSAPSPPAGPDPR